MKKLLLLTIFLLLIMSCGNNKKPDHSLERIIHKGYIVFGYQDKTAPFIFTRNGKETGFLREFIELLERNLLIKIHYKKIPDNTFPIEELNSGNVDFIIGPDIYRDYDNLFISSDVLFNMELAILKKYGTHKDMSLYVDSIISDRSVLSENFKIYTPEKFMSFFNSKKSESILTDSARAQWIAQEYPHKYFTENHNDTTVNYRIFLRSGEYKLLEKIDSALSNTVSHSRIKKSSTIWFGVDRLPLKLF